MAMTEEERRIARNEASKRWYQAHKAKKAGKTAVAATEPEPTDLKSKIAKFVENSKPVLDSADKVIKDAAALLEEAYKSGDQDLIDRTRKDFGKKLSLSLENDTVSFVSPAAQFKRPAETGTNSESSEHVMYVDQATLEGLEDGTVTEDEIKPADSDEDDKDGEDEDDDKCASARLAELEDIDPDDLTDEEKDELAELTSRNIESDWRDGSADTMRELEAQGAYDD